VISEAAAEHLGDVEQLVDQRFRLFRPAQSVVIFGDELDHVMGGEIQTGLKGLGQSVAAGEDPATSGSPASDGAYATGKDVIHFKRTDDPRQFLVDVRCREIFQCSTP